MAAAASRSCPSCGASCAARASLCDRCNEILPALPTPSSADDEAELRAALFRAPPRPYPARSAQPGKLRARTLVLALLMATGIGLLAWTWDVSLDGTDSIVAVKIWGWLISVAAGLGFAFALLSDVITPSPRGRATPERAVRAYFDSVRRRRWAAAFACLSPYTHGRLLTAPSLAVLKSLPRTVALDSAAAIATYYADLCGPSRDGDRAMTRLRVRLAGGDRNVARVRVQMRLSLTPAHPRALALAHELALFLRWFMRESVTLELEVLVHLHAGQYWVFGGGCTGGPPVL